MIFQEIILHDYSKPLAARKRGICGPYHWTPTTPGGERGFYCDSGSGSVLTCDGHGSPFRLRLVLANSLYYRQDRRPKGYYCDPFQGDTITPIIARLPRSRGFLAGWTMGAGMCAMLELEILDYAEDAADRAHYLAKRDADREWDAYEQDQAQQLAEEREEKEREAATLANTMAYLPL